MRTCTSVPRSSCSPGENVIWPAFSTSAPGRLRQAMRRLGSSSVISASHSKRLPPSCSALGDPVRPAVVDHAHLFRCVMIRGQVLEVAPEAVELLERAADGERLRHAHAAGEVVLRFASRRPSHRLRFGRVADGGVDAERFVAVDTCRSRRDAAGCRRRRQWRGPTASRRASPSRAQDAARGERGLPFGRADVLARGDALPLLRRLLLLRRREQGRRVVRADERWTSLAFRDQSPVVLARSASGIVDGLLVIPDPPPLGCHRRRCAAMRRARMTRRSNENASGLGER